MDEGLTITIEHAGQSVTTTTKGLHEAANRLRHERTGNMAKPQKVKYNPINHGDFPEPWKILQSLRGHHSNLDGAEIQLVWMYDKRPDRDGVKLLGKAVKVPEVYQRLTDIDFLIFLNRDEWILFESYGDPERMKRFLIDHEMCHCDRDYDEETGDQKEDASGRKLWRIRKHDIEEFEGPIRRHGLCMQDVIRFAGVIEEAQAVLPFPKEDKAAKAAKKGSAAA